MFVYKFYLNIFIYIGWNVPEFLIKIKRIYKIYYR